MKKILVIHNKYKLVGGEDIAVDNEILFLKRFYEVETLFFENKTSNLLLQFFCSLHSLSSVILSRTRSNYRGVHGFIADFWFVIFVFSYGRF